jgi:mono/diheme cytochrome c family protein
MKTGMIALALCGLTMNTFRGVPPIRSMTFTRQASPGSATSARSVWDGVYTDSQMKRGAAIYLRECSGCHGEALRGGESTRALTGSDFDESWNGKTVADLFDKIRQTMPPRPDQPGKLSPQQEADVIAHILGNNDFPVGTVELPQDIEQLRRIRITTTRP